MKKHRLTLFLVIIGCILAGILMFMLRGNIDKGEVFSIGFDKTGIVASIFAYLILNIIIKLKYNKGIIFFIFFTLFYIYIILVIQVTQFPIYSTESLRENIGTVALGKGINLIPFKASLHLPSIYNIVMFVPFGFLYPFIWKNSIKKVTLHGFAFSFIIEITQLIISIIVGYPLRVTDINDLIFNTFGAIIGFALFLAIRKFMNLVIKNKSNKILVYLYQR